VQQKGLGRRAFVRALGGVLSAAAVRGQGRKGPNVIIILADDLGYGDLGCYGSTIATPNLDSMAREGMRLTRFYSASAVCSPSRAALLTGRYPARTGIVNVLMPNADVGLKPYERTIPKILKEQGYRTGCIGKWHLGTATGCMPNGQGFDEYYGVPYSNDMNPLPVMRDSNVVEAAPRQTSLTTQFTDQAVEFIARNREQPFFLYLAHTAPHIPLAPSERFAGTSEHGLYGDVVTELDWSVGEVLRAVKENGLDEQTLVIFASDNGPWYQGSSGNLQGRKGSTYEGGIRVPCIARFPGSIPAGTVAEGISSTMDLLPTITRLTGGTAGSVDGVDIWPMLSGEVQYVGREVLLFFDVWNVQCVRWGPWKLHLSRYNSNPWTVDPPGGRVNLPLANPELYHVDADPGESYDRAPENKQLVLDLQQRAERLLLTFPEPARAAWRDTLARRVQQTPAGSLPQPEN
jgi:arylsulfatase A